MTSQSPRTQHVSPDRKINQKVTYRIYVEGSRCDCLFLHCSYDFHSRPYFRRLLKASLFQLCRTLMNPSQKTPNLTKKQNQVNYRADSQNTSFSVFERMKQSFKFLQGSNRDTVSLSVIIAFANKISKYSEMYTY